MRRVVAVLATAVLALGGLAACGDDEDNTPVTPATSEAAPTPSTPQSPETQGPVYTPPSSEAPSTGTADTAGYLNFTRTNALFKFPSTVSDDSLVQLGSTTCEALRAGQSPSAVANAMYDGFNNNIDNSTAAKASLVVIVGASRYLCSDQYDKVKSYIQSLDNGSDDGTADQGSGDVITG